MTKKEEELLFRAALRRQVQVEFALKLADALENILNPPMNDYEDAKNRLKARETLTEWGKVNT